MQYKVTEPMLFHSEENDFESNKKYEWISTFSPQNKLHAEEIENLFSSAT